MRFRAGGDRHWRVDYIGFTMEWSDEALILSVRPHGETASIVELFTRDNGRHLGLVHGGRSRRRRPVLQIGNYIEANWKARLADHLGHMTVELRRGFAAEVMEDRGRPCRSEFANGSGTAAS